MSLIKLYLEVYLIWINCLMKKWILYGLHFLYISRKIYLEALAYMIMEAGRSQICRAGQWAGDKEKIAVHGQRLAGFPLSWRRSVFFLRPSTD